MKANVLVTTAGTIVAQGVIKCLRLANRSENRPVTYGIVTADMSPDTAALYRSDAGYLVPPISSSDYIDAISRYAKMKESAQSSWAQMRNSSQWQAQEKESKTKQELL